MSRPRGHGAIDRFSREHATFVRRTWIVVELSLVAATLIAGTAAPQRAFASEPAAPGAIVSLFVAVVVAAAWSMTMYALGAYHSQRFMTLGGVLLQLSVAQAVAAATLACLVAISSVPAVSLLFAPASLAVLLTERATVMAVLHGIRRRGGQAHRVLLIASGSAATTAETAIADRSELGLRLVATVRLADMSRPGHVLKRTRPDELIIAESAIPTDTLANVALEAQLHGINVRQVVPRWRGNPLHVGVGKLNGGLIVTLFSTRGRPGEVVAKRMVDFFGASVLLLLTLPLMALSALAIAGGGGRPIYRQTRVGRNGAPFTMYKFRTMEHNADSRRAELEATNEMSPPVFKRSNDPRVTRIGRFLRRWSIDELPQLINVIKGDMSLVGPRPARPHEVEQYETWQKRRFCVKPGLTGPWQVAGRSEVDFAEWMRLDAEYVNRWTMWRDIEILLQTVPTIILGRGAH